jgi:hypothetical protein
MLFFDFYNLEDSLTLYLWIGPTMPAEVRTELLEIVAKRRSPFCKPVPEKGGWHYGYKLEFLTRKDYIECSDDALRAIIDTKWSEFRERDLRRIRDALQNKDWFWRAPSQ